MKSTDLILGLLIGATLTYFGIATYIFLRDTETTQVICDKEVGK